MQTNKVELRKRETVHNGETSGRTAEYTDVYGNTRKIRVDSRKGESKDFEAELQKLAFLNRGQIIKVNDK